jgi:hypothetical protein
MIHIKRFIDKIASMEGKQGRDVVLPISDARALRDEITKLLLDQRETNTTQQTNEVVQVEMKGEKW